MEIVIKADDVKDWVYKGEGGANIILSYQGSSPLLLGKVLRIQKVPKDETKPPSACGQLSMHEQLLWGDVAELIESNLEESLVQNYACCIMGPRLGRNHIDAGVRVSVSREFLENVEDSTLNFRPAWRIKASKIDILTKSALLISDHSVFASNSTFSIAVEIKPKCGFLPSSEYIPDENFIKKQVTRYKMHQALKLYKSQIPEESAYDPLDLFSQSKERIQKALNALYQAPQNNFRVFVNGYLIYGGMDTGSNNHDANSSFEELIGTTNGLNLNLPKIFKLLTEMISKSGVLNQLLETQKLDLYDIEGAIHSYYDVISQPCLVCESISDKGLLEKFEKLHSLPIERSIEIVRDYLVSATAKDCSLMISFRPRKSEADGSEGYGSVSIESVDQVYDYKAISSLKILTQSSCQSFGLFETSQEIPNNIRSLFTMAESLLSSNFDIIFTILSLLPTETLLLVQTVCRAWAWVISDQAFRQAHCFRPAPVTTLFTRRFKLTVDGSSEQFVKPFQEGDRFPSSISGILSNGFKAVSYNHGILCFERDMVFVVGNPVISSWSVVRYAPSLSSYQYRGVVLIYDPAISLNFKLALVLIKFDQSEEGKYCIQFNIYSSETCSWTKSSEFIQEEFHWESGQYKPCKIGGGSVCWIDIFGFLWGYEISTDTYWKTPLPRPFDEAGSESMSSYDSIIYFTSINYGVAKVWSLKGKDSWVLEGEGSSEVLCQLVFHVFVYDRVRRVMLIENRECGDFFALHLSSSRLEILSQGVEFPDGLFDITQLDHSNTLAPLCGAETGMDGLAREFRWIKLSSLLNKILLTIKSFWFGIY